MQNQHRNDHWRLGSAVAAGLGLVLSAASPALADELVSVHVQVVDDVSSCDYDGILDHGEVGRVLVAVHNHTDVAMGGITVGLKPLSPELMLPKGDSVEVYKLAPHSSVVAQFQAKLIKATSGQVSLRAEVQFPTELGIPAELVDIDAPADVDDVFGSSNVDDVESSASAWRSEDSGFYGPNAGWSRGMDENGNGVWFMVGSSNGAHASLVSPAMQPAHNEDFVLTFAHRFDFSGDQDWGFAGGVIEISTDDGRRWEDISAYAEVPYNGRMDSHASDLENRRAFVGHSPSMPGRDTVDLNLGRTFQGETVWVRFRMAAEGAAPGAGWELDDFEVSGVYNHPFASRVSHRGRCMPAPVATLHPVSAMFPGQLRNVSPSADELGTDIDFGATPAVETVEVDRSEPAIVAVSPMAPERSVKLSGFGRINAGQVAAASGCSAMAGTPGSVPFAMGLVMLGWAGLVRRRRLATHDVD